jgi:capsular polysaccharide transport system permease protein
MTEIVASPQGEDGGSAPPVQRETGLSPFVFQYRVLKALVLRDIAQRNGESRIGFLLSIIMPIVTITVIAVFFGLRGKVIPTNMPLSVFVITGYPLWMGFQQSYQKVMNTAGRADPLLYFPQITQLDLILAQIILDFATNTVVFFLMMLGVIIVFNAQPPSNPFGVVLCLWGVIWLGSALGMILCGINRFAPMVVTFLNTFMRFGMWISGVIYSINRLPSFLWPYLQWNPILHLIEGGRHNWTPDFDAPIYSPSYVIAIGFILTTLGFVIERLTRRLVA